jgi:hypothetical protein
MGQQQQTTAGQQPIAGQPAAVGHQATAGGRVGGKFEDHLPNEVLTVLQDFQRLESLSAWCAEQCLEMGGQMAQAANTCHDVLDFAHLGVQFMSRNPDRQYEVGEFILRYLQDARQKLAGYQSEPTQQLVEALDRAIASVQQALAQTGAQQQRGQASAGVQQQRPNQQTPMRSEGPRQPSQQIPVQAGGQQSGLQRPTQ